MQSYMHSFYWLETHPPNINPNLSPPPAAPHLHAVSQDKLVDDEGDEVAAAHLPRDDKVAPIVEDTDLDHQESELHRGERPWVMFPGLSFPGPCPLLCPQPCEYEQESSFFWNSSHWTW